MKKKKYDISRTSIKEYTKLKLWALSAGRCEICNALLYKDNSHGFDGNFSNIAHIIGVGEDGPRSSEDLGDEKNKYENLMLLCPTCHHEIDTKVDYFQKNYLAGLKYEHEKRVEFLTGIDSNKECQIVTYLMNVNEAVKQYSSLKSMLLAVADFKMFPKQNSLIDLCDDAGVKYVHSKQTIIEKSRELEIQFNKTIKQFTKDSLAVFAFTCQPLLFKLGTLLGDQREVVVFQPQRDSLKNRWSFDLNEGKIAYITKRKYSSKFHKVALVLDLSAEIKDGRIESVLGKDVNIYHITINNPNRLFVTSLSIQNGFVETFRKCLENIKRENELVDEIHIFPAMPVSLAIRAGMDRMPKVDPKWIIYEQSNVNEGFYETLTIGE